MENKKHIQHYLLDRYGRALFDAVESVRFNFPINIDVEASYLLGQQEKTKDDAALTGNFLLKIYKKVKERKRRVKGRGSWDTLGRLTAEQFNIGALAILGGLGIDYRSRQTAFLTSYLLIGTIFIVKIPGSESEYRLLDTSEAINIYANFLNNISETGDELPYFLNASAEVTEKTLDGLDKRIQKRVDRVLSDPEVAMQLSDPLLSDLKLELFRQIFYRFYPKGPSYLEVITGLYLDELSKEDRGFYEDTVRSNQNKLGRTSEDLEHVFNDWAGICLNALKANYLEVNGLTAYADLWLQQDNGILQWRTFDHPLSHSFYVDVAKLYSEFDFAEQLKKIGDWEKL